MEPKLSVAVDPWALEIIAVLHASHSSGDRRALHRDVQRGLLVRLRKGAYVERSAYESLTPEQRHIVRMRALATVSDRPVVFSHWSAAVLHGLPVLRERLLALHSTVDAAGERSHQGVTAHVFRIMDTEVVRFGDVLSTGLGRTVVDVAGAGALEEGVMAADGALHTGLLRVVLEAALDVAGPRRAARRSAEVVALAHAGAESAAESRGRVTMLRLGVEVPELQHRLVLADGRDVHLDFFFPSRRVGAEADGDVKYLDPAMAPEGAGRAVIAEKRREDQMRSQLDGLVRFGWVESGSAALLRPALARSGVITSRPRTTSADYAAAALDSRPRFVPRRRPQGPALVRPSAADAAERTAAPAAGDRISAGRGGGRG